MRQGLFLCCRRLQRRVRGGMNTQAIWMGVVILLCTSACMSQELDRAVERLIQSSGLENMRIGVSIRETESGLVLASVDADEGYIPASNMKLLTTGAALSVLGPDFVFKTELKLDGDRLIIVGAGDPALADPALLGRMVPQRTVEDLLSLLAEAVVKSGVEHLSEIIVDDRIFDRNYVHPEWPKDQLIEWYCAEVSGLNFHTNVLSVYPRPSSLGPGNAPHVVAEPAAPWIEFIIKARTVAQGRNKVWLVRDPNLNRYSVHGEVRYASQAPIEVAVHEPGLLTGQLLADRLSQRGVVFGDNTKATSHGARATVRLAEADENLLDGRVLAIVTTHIKDVLERCNLNSQNLFAESLLKLIWNKTTGEPGSWEGGAAIIRMLLAEKLGPHQAVSTVISDGSGMSRKNSVAPETMTEWLCAIESDEKIGQAFLDSLATPGKGTLRRRFQKYTPHHEVQAKSGSINGVRCLSGFVTNEATGQRVAFSVFVNDVPLDRSARPVLEFHESVVAIIETWLDEQAAFLVPGG